MLEGAISHSLPASVDRAALFESAKVARLVRKDKVEEVKAALDGGADVNQRLLCGRTLLMVRHENPAMTRLLVEKGADVNAKDELGRTALQWARWREFKEVVSVLKAAGATE